jgi:hypothetical protein
VGTATLNSLRSYAIFLRNTRPAGACTGAGGSFDGVAFTQAEECHAVELLNKARMSELRELGDVARAVGYHANLSTLRTFSDRAGIGGTAMGQVKSAAAAWTINGLSYDTIASTWTNRARLLNGPVFIEKAWVARTLPELVDAGYSVSCAELRDSPTATNYLFACVPIVWNESRCPNRECWGGLIGTWVSANGALRSSQISGSGGYRIGLSYGPGQPNTDIP